MNQAFSRTRLLIGEKGLDRLSRSRVAVFGVGGVGGYAIEALVRSGVQNITVVDNDTVALSNLNRQIIATDLSVGENKVFVMKKRILSINKNANVNAINLLYLPQTAGQIDLAEFDYIIDAIDTVTAKLELIKRATEKNVPIISCMGTGGKTDITKLQVVDIYKTNNCPLAKVMRKELKTLGVEKLKVVYSNEQPLIALEEESSAEKRASGRRVPPSMIFVPAAAGLMLAREVVFDLINRG